MPTTDGSQLVAIRIAHIGRIEIRAVMQSQAGRALAAATVGESRRVELVHLLPPSRPERNHTAVAARRRLLIERFADPECELARTAVLVQAPARRDAIPFRVAGDATLHLERRQCRIVEPYGALEIVGAEIDVGEHGVLLSATPRASRRAKRRRSTAARP